MAPPRNLDRENAAYRCWEAMIHRCTSPLRHDSLRYCGLPLQEEWRNSFKVFLEDLGERPSGEHQLDRIIPELGYVKGNVHWVTQFENLQNRKPGKTGLQRVECVGRKWRVRTYTEKRFKTLYYGPDFFEACCVAKSLTSHL